MTPADLRAYRQQHDLTQDELASMLGVHPRTVKRWELGEVRIPATVGPLLPRFTRSELAAARRLRAREGKYRRGARKEA